MTQMLYTPKAEIDARISTLQQTLAKLDIDGALIIHHTNFFYYSGTSQGGHLFIPREGKPILMIRKSFTRASMESPIETIIDVKTPKAIPGILQERGFAFSKVGIELDIIPYNTWQFYSKIFADTAFVDISGAVKVQRAVKSDYELGLMQRSCAIIDEVFSEVPAMVREGMPEIELASLFEAGMRRRGYGGCSKMRAFNQDFFLGNVNTGASGASPTYFDGPVGGPGLTPANNPHGAGWKNIARNEIIFIDYTCVVNGYTADCARMFVLGDLSEKMYEAHAASLKIQEALMTMMRPGMPCEDIHLHSLQMAEDMGLSDSYMGIGQDKVRFVGHGLGLELDEFPIFAKGLKMPLAAGMTFALEPKFVFPEGAIGIENTFVLREDGAHKMTHGPENIIKL